MFDRTKYYREYNRRPEYRATRLAYNREYMRRNKLRAIQYMGGKCVDCGFDDVSRPEVFDFDHLRDKAINFAQWGTVRFERWLPELDKCELVCSNCHRTRTKERANA